MFATCSEENYDHMTNSLLISSWVYLCEKLGLHLVHETTWVWNKSLGDSKNKQRQRFQLCQMGKDHKEKNIGVSSVKIFSGLNEDFN